MNKCKISKYEKTAVLDLEKRKPKATTKIAEVKKVITVVKSKGNNKKIIVPLSNYLKCPISGHPLEVNKEGNIQADYITYKKVNNIFIIQEDKAEINL